MTDRWRVATASLLAEIGSNPQVSVLRQPLAILAELLSQVAARAIELQDPELDRLMLQLSLYSIADPGCPDFDLKRSSDLIHGGPDARK